MNARTTNDDKKNLESEILESLKCLGENYLENDGGGYSLDDMKWFLGSLLLGDTEMNRILGNLIETNQIEWVNRSASEPEDMHYRVKEP